MPKCKYCGDRPFKTYCQSFFDHQESCKKAFNYGINKNKNKNKNNLLRTQKNIRCDAPVTNNINNAQNEKYTCNAYNTYNAYNVYNVYNEYNKHNTRDKCNEYNKRNANNLINRRKFVIVKNIGNVQVEFKIGTGNDLVAIIDSEIIHANNNKILDEINCSCKHAKIEAITHVISQLCCIKKQIDEQYTPTNPLCPLCPIYFDIMAKLKECYDKMSSMLSQCDPKMQFEQKKINHVDKNTDISKYVNT